MDDSVLLIYSRQVVKKTAHVSGSVGWNREHSFAKSLFGEAAPAVNDNHHIFADDNKTNGHRGNKPFNELNKTSSTRSIDGYGNTTDNYYTNEYFMPNDLAKGEVARATMYMNTRYDYSITLNFYSIDLMLKWHLENPVTNREIYRNNVVHRNQKNRNPYIDHPEYACSVWGDTNTNTRNVCASYSSAEVEQVTISPTYSTINLLSEVKGVQLSADVLPSNASNKNVTWSSTNTSVASVSSSGYVTGLSVGQTTIFATSVSNPNKKAQASIEVVSETTLVSGVSLNKSTTTIEIGKTETLVATVSPSGATNKSVTWTSTNPTIASVNNGVVTGLAIGTATISAKTNDGNFIASALVTVVAPAPVTTITGSFYNTTNNNDGGAGGVTKTNLNNGTMGANSFIGFGGKEVISTVNPSNAYLPRGGGLALGSSGVEGFLEITLNNDYKANKVEVLINNSVKDAEASLETNIVPTSNKTGTNGVQYSYPSAGTYYTLEFNQPHNYFKIKTTMRMIVVEIRLTIGGGSVIEETPQEEAEAWSSNFLTLKNLGCTLSDRDILLGAWNEAMYSFENLSSEAQLIIKESVAEPDPNNNVKHAKARYQVIVKGYQFNDFINNQSSINSRVQNNNFLFPSAFILIASVLVFSLGFILIQLKNKKQK